YCLDPTTDHCCNQPTGAPYCKNGETCCGKHCTELGGKCCNATTGLTCRAEYQCCGDHCCPQDAICCGVGATCCPPDTQCPDCSACREPLCGGGCCQGDMTFCCATSTRLEGN